MAIHTRCQKTRVPFETQRALRYGRFVREMM